MYRTQFTEFHHYSHKKYLNTMNLSKPCSPISFLHFSLILYFAFYALLKLTQLPYWMHACSEQIAIYLWVSSCIQTSLLYKCTTVLCKNAYEDDLVHAWWVPVVIVQCTVPRKRKHFLYWLEMRQLCTKPKMRQPFRK